MKQIILSRVLTLLFFLFLLSSSVYAGDLFYSKPGDVLKLIIKDKPEIKSISARYLNRNVKFFKLGTKWRGLFSSMPEKKPGKYPLVLKVETTSGDCESFHNQVRLARKKFPTVYFTLKPGKKKLLTGSTIADEWTQIEKYLIVKQPEQLWERRFVKPVPGIITMGFGRREFVNKKRRGYHRGVDFRAAVGTKVKAVNSGQVVFAKQLKAFGGTIIIDHGQGVHSLYFHLSEFLVSSGSLVKKGQYVAKTGNSGISSGPHLHWGLSVNNVRVNPLQWTKQVM
ncbi:MAG: M23 family metallopeptidase [Candidatus Saganbacteria bacterium]|nr:M23 family metallopeptidase [Candidatus Saganbacteria bacterium]